MSTALIAKALTEDLRFRPLVVLPKGEANQTIFESYKVDVSWLPASDAQILRLRRASGVSGYLKALPALHSAHRAAMKSLKSLRPLLVHVNDDRTMIPWGFAAKRLQIPVVWHIRQERPSPALDTVRLYLADHLIFVANANRTRFAGLKIPPSTLIHNWVETAVFQPPPDRAHWKSLLGFPPERLLVGYIGNLVARKRPEWAVEAVAAAQNEGISVDLAVVGEDFTGGEITARLKAIAESRGMGTTLHMLGFRQDVPELLKAFDVLVLPSITKGEAFPRVIIEGMASGVAVVATDVAGVSEAVENGVTGLLADPDSLHDFKEKLGRMLRDEAFRSRAQLDAVERARSRFSAAQAAEELVAVYSGVLAGRATPTEAKSQAP